MTREAEAPAGGNGQGPDDHSGRVVGSIPGWPNTSNQPVASRRSRRFSPIGLAQIHKLPNTKEKLLFLASAEGQAMRIEADFERLGKRERPVGVLVGPTHRRRILEQTGASRSLWDRATKEWERLGLAHRCDRKRLFIFVDPAPACWQCGELVETSPNSAVVVAVQRHSVAEQRCFRHENKAATRDEQGIGLEAGVLRGVGEEAVAVEEEELDVPEKSARPGEIEAEDVRLARASWGLTEADHAS
jgi:hypothetical protein